MKRREKMWFKSFPDSDVPSLLAEVARVLRPGRHAYLFCDPPSLKLIFAATASMFRYDKPLIWDKVDLGMGYHYRARYEFIWFAVTGGGKERHVSNLGVPDVLPYKRVRRGYPTEKPIELVKLLVEQSTKSGELVLDCFFGSGVVADACRQTGRRFIGCDVSKDANEYAAGRLASE